MSPRPGSVGFRKGEGVSDREGCVSKGMEAVSTRLRTNQGGGQRTQTVHACLQGLGGSHAFGKHMAETEWKDVTDMWAKLEGLDINKVSGIGTWNRIGHKIGKSFIGRGGS